MAYTKSEKDYGIGKLPSNSMRKQSETKVIKAVAKAKLREKPFLMRIFSDNMSNIGHYIIWDVLIPAAKNTFSEIITNGIEMLLYGDDQPSRRTSRFSRSRGRSYVSYNSIYDKREARPTLSRPRSRHTFDDVILESRQDCEEVLSSLLELIDSYDVATVADFYAAVGLEAEWADNKFGWDNLSTAEVRRVREGYILIMPKPLTLD